MSLLTLSGIMLAILIISILYEPRNYWNALLMLLTAGVFLLGIGVSSELGAKIEAVIIILIPVVFFGAAVFLIINGFIMIKREGRHLQNILSLLMGIAMIAGTFITVDVMIRFQDGILFKMLVLLLLILEFYMAFAFVALLIYSCIYSLIPKRIRCDYIIVHGCGLIDGERVSPLLKSRVDKAVRVYQRWAARNEGADRDEAKDSSRPKLVLSGGQGCDEKISEAAAMKNYLLEIGFPEEDVILEEKSTTTFENLKNVRDMFDVGGRKHRYIFVTSNYHVFRTGLFAKKLKMKAAGVGCRTAVYFWPSAFIREYIAIMVKYKWIFVAIILLWGLATWKALV